MPNEYYNEDYCVCKTCGSDHIEWINDMEYKCLVCDTKGHILSDDEINKLVGLL